MELSLDDYIVQKKVSVKGRGGINRARQQGRGNAPNRTGNTNQNKKFTNNRNQGGRVNTGRVNTGRVISGRVNTGRVISGRVNTGRVNTGRAGEVNLPRPITDARQKIIQKNRQKLTDAREKLGELAKQTDARFKLEKLRVGRQAGRVPLPASNARLPGRRNNDQQQRRNLQFPLQRTIRRPVGTVVVPNNWYQPAVDDMDIEMDVDMDTPLAGVSQVLRRTIPNEHATSRQLQRSTTSSSRPISQHRPQKEVQPVSRGYVDTDYPGEERIRGKPQTNVSLTNRWGNHGNQPATPPPSPRNVPAPRMTGYRIIISNLHPSVIDEDIKELFADVGPLLESRLVRPGVAEVTFKLLKDAEKAVEIYHNRHLDRQPMKCLLVNGRQAGLTNPPSHSARTTNSARAGVKIGSGSKSAVVPDISTIHKALFDRPSYIYEQ